VIVNVSSVAGPAARLAGHWAYAASNMQRERSRLTCGRGVPSASGGGLIEPGFFATSVVRKGRPLPSASPYGRAGAPSSPAGITPTSRWVATLPTWQPPSPPPSTPGQSRPRAGRTRCPRAASRGVEHDREQWQTPAEGLRDRGLSGQGVGEDDGDRPGSLGRRPGIQLCCLPRWAAPPRRGPSGRPTTTRSTVIGLEHPRPPTLRELRHAPHRPRCQQRQ